MKTIKAIEALCLTVLILLSTPTTHAETIRFGDEGDQFEIDFVPIGLPGNPPDSRVDYQGEHVGQVDYEFGMAKFETTCTDIDLVKRQGDHFDLAKQTECLTLIT